MRKTKDEEKALQNKLPDDCSLEAVQHPLYVAEKIHHGIQRAAEEGMLSQHEVETKFSKWTKQ